jgi:Rieske Fe-S protein
MAVLLLGAGVALAIALTESTPTHSLVTMTELRQRQVIRMEERPVFLVYNDGKPLALSDDAQHLGSDDRVVFCKSSGMFESPAHGEKFDLAGRYHGGPARRGLDRYRLWVDDGQVFVDFGDVIHGPKRGEPAGDEPIGPFCY